VAGDEPVTSPDQHKPANMKALRVGAVVTAIILLLMIMGNHTGRTEDIFLALSAGALIFMLIVDWMLRRNGLRG
jgi:xanthine/uracil permease